MTPVVPSNEVMLCPETGRACGFSADCGGLDYCKRRTSADLPINASERRWTLRICRECGDHHGGFHDGCVTYSHPMFPQMTEHAGVDEVEVIPAEVTDEMVEAINGLLRVIDGKVSETDAQTDIAHARRVVAAFSTKEVEG